MRLACAALALVFEVHVEARIRTTRLKDANTGWWVVASRVLSSFLVGAGMWRPL